MKRLTLLFSMACIAGSCVMAGAEPVDMGAVMNAVQREVSGERARDYVMRLWRYDKWSTLPMWQKSAEEARTIMHERGFDEAQVVRTPADGVTQYGTWTNPIGWDATDATLEVVEPAGLPDEFRFLCNYRHNPTSLGDFSAPTPPEGIETELVMLDESSEEALRRADARGKLILVSSNSRGMKQFLDTYGVLGIVSDQIEADNSDFINANQWLNGWTDKPGGWIMNASDSRNHIRFSISQKKGNYLRDLMRSGKKVIVRAKVDSRYYTDSYLPYVDGCLRGTGDEEVLVAGHMCEWGANDNATGCSAIMEAVGTLAALVEEGVLPRPRRTIRVWLGHELYGSMAYTMNNLERMRTKTVAALCCDTACEDYDTATTAMLVSTNFNNSVCFTDAVLPEVVRRFHDDNNNPKLWKVFGFMGGLDTFFGDPLINVPVNAISMENGGHLHHNSMDTIDKVDPRTLRDLSTVNAVYLYYLASAGRPDARYIADLVHDRGCRVILDRATAMKGRLGGVTDGDELGRILAEGTRTIEYYTGLQKKAVMSINRIVPDDEEKAAAPMFERVCDDLEDYGALMVEQFEGAVEAAARDASVKVVRWKPEMTEWRKRAGTIVPKRTKVGTLTLDGIPVDEWREVSRAPTWWNARNWAAASYFWCDGERNLNEVKELCELEAGVPMTGFDLIEYYTFLEKHGMVEFVK